MSYSRKTVGESSDGLTKTRKGWLSRRVLLIWGIFWQILKDPKSVAAPADTLSACKHLPQVAATFQIQ
jgi:hypothetical protein